MTLNEWRIQKEYNLSSVAYLLDTSIKNVSRWCNQVVLPQPEMLMRIQDLTLGAVNPADFYGDTNDFYER